MAAKNPYLPLYYNDLRGSTLDWTDEEFGAYVRLLIYQWDKGSIPSRMSRLVKIADSTEKNWPVLSEKFTPASNGFLQNSVMEIIREKHTKFSQKQSKNVKKRWAKKRKSAQQNRGKASSSIDLDNDTKFLPNKYPRVENENEYDNENKDKGSGEKEKSETLFTPEFQVSWREWNLYRFEEFRKKYRSAQSEKKALAHLAKISGGDEENAKAIIDQSIANQWQGFFELKNDTNGGGKSSKNTGTGKGKSTGAHELLEEIRTTPTADKRGK